MSGIAEIEDKLIEAVEAAALFKTVSSAGRREIQPPKTFPAAYVYFVSERDTGAMPRPVVELTYDVVVAAKNLSSEEMAAKDVYALMSSVRDALNGKTLGFTDLEPLTCAAMELAGYEAGVIEYVLRFRTRRYLPVPVE